MKITEHVRARRIKGEYYLTWRTLPEGKRTQRKVTIPVDGREELLEYAEASGIAEEAEEAMRKLRPERWINELNKTSPWPKIVNAYEIALDRQGAVANSIPARIRLIKRFLKWCERTEIRDIHPSDVDRWVNTQKKAWSATYRKALLTHIRSFLSWAIANDLMRKERNPASSDLVRVRVRDLPQSQRMPKRMSAFDDQAFDKLQGYLEERTQEARQKLTAGEMASYRGDRRVLRRRTIYREIRKMHFWKAATHISYAYGLRLGDVCTLEFESLSSPGWLRLMTNKTCHPLEIPFSDEAIEEFLMEEAHHSQRDRLREALQVSAAYMNKGVDLMCENPLSHEDEDWMPSFEYCFPAYAASYTGSLTGPNIVSGEFHALTRRGGFNRMGFHCFRRGRIRAWKRMGVTLEDIARVVGHASASTTRGYL